MHLTKLRALVERKLGEDTEAVQRVAPILKEAEVVTMLDEFIELASIAERKGPLTRKSLMKLLEIFEESFPDISLEELTSDLHATYLAANIEVAARVYEIEVLVGRLMPEELRNLPCFWFPGGVPIDFKPTREESTLYLGRLKLAVRNKVFNFFARDGLIPLESTVELLEVLKKIPQGHRRWDTEYLQHFLDKHYGTSHGAAMLVTFNHVWEMCADGVLEGEYPLARLGIEASDLLCEFCGNMSGAAMAYLLVKFLEFDVHSQGFIGDEVMQVMGMASCPTNSSEAVTLCNKLKFGADHGADTLWKLDNNGDGRVSATEWALFFVRIAGGNPQQMIALASEMRLHDVGKLMTIRNRGLLRDRHMALFDAIDSDGNGALDIDELIRLVACSGTLVLFGEERRNELAESQLRSIAHDCNGQIHLAEWLRYAQMRGELEEMNARNCHYFEEMYGHFQV